MRLLTAVYGTKRTDRDLCLLVRFRGKADTTSRDPRGRDGGIRQGLGGVSRVRA